MIEYLHDCVRATAGEDICICAIITDDAGELVAINSHLMFYDNTECLATIPGVFDDEKWSFTIPAELTTGRVGRYWYCICTGGESLNFKQPIYLI